MIHAAPNIASLALTLLPFRYHHMKHFPRALAALAIVAVVTPTHLLRAQTCYGTPSRSSLSANYARVTFGTSVGATGTLAGQRVALSLGGRSVSYGSSTSGFGADTRFSIALGSDKLKICPAIGLDFEQREWTVAPGKVTTMQLGASGGVGIGYEHMIGDNIHIIPFANGRYQFTLSKFDFSASDALSQTTADTLSGVHIQLGVVAQLGQFYIGAMGDNLVTSGAASMGRVFAGITFATSRKK